MQKNTNTLLESTVALKNGNCKSKSEYWQYSALPENFYHADFGKYHTYGIQVTGNNCMEIIHDVTTCEETADRIVDCFNRHQLSPIHFRDAIEDMLP